MAGRGSDENVSTSSPAGFSNGHAVARARVEEGLFARVMGTTLAFATTRRLFRRELVVASAAQRGDLIVTGDADDLRPLAVSIGNVTVEPLR
jgi:hypothetical protein